MLYLLGFKIWNMEKKSMYAYVCPAVESIDVCSEGVLCESNGQLETMSEHQGSWGPKMVTFDLLNL